MSYRISLFIRYITHRNCYQYYDQLKYRVFNIFTVTLIILSPSWMQATLSPQPGMQYHYYDQLKFKVFIIFTVILIIMSPSQIQATLFPQPGMQQDPFLTPRYSDKLPYQNNQKKSVFSLCA